MMKYCEVVTNRCIEPKHAHGIVVPDRHDQNHAGLEGVAHRSETTLCLEIVGITEGSLLSSAEAVGDRVASHASDVRDGVLVHDAVLDVQTTNLGQSAGLGTVVSDKLRDDSHLLRGVKSLARAVERSVAHAVAVEVTAALVAEAAGAIGRSALFVLQGVSKSVSSNAVTSYEPKCRPRNRPGCKDAECMPC